MKICLCTTPIRPKPTTFPPLGSMAIIQALRKIDQPVDKDNNIIINNFIKYEAKSQCIFL